ncbi:4-hydroxy-2-oxovalerate aldolase [Paenibacillus mucilaginosus]|uniref:4-hydroxy-2-oxovalerate aldolase n=1 Tax=Paenibacillus mucilaginosus (strain KNP414) TaxID=1036673 RepID=F8FJP3_PAEMK|nr:4-hydroxy-2-oxovalerate aldolase [Paenibacillus mucilaginosus]AEI42893.1 4-hydroxy-2-oxovalerate aldolase [Paenibacillus mucilaginosus KNP414]MCG7216518.1 4-hydroxy-2-oxovalerate aldolase [Paenibacillus mucilaginosus]WDM31056.1 4-hydroxy-2-oxovalerate aldolase [Paenibacillus mucilaginosus]
MRIRISDPTLRDGQHAVAHQLSERHIRLYARAANAAGVPIVEVGHGNGLGASSLLIGKSRVSDRCMLLAAREELTSSRLGIHLIPGFATIERDVRPAIELGVDVFRVASHCSEADLTRRHIEFLRGEEKEVHGVLMMSHMAPVTVLVEEALKMQSYGAQAVIIMDSAGSYMPREVTDRIGELCGALSVPVGFHAHNNLGLAIANTVAAVEAGARLVDGTARGFGAGAGNTQLEVLIAVLHKLGYETGIELTGMLAASDLAEREFVHTLPFSKSMSIISGLTGVFSGYAKPVEQMSREYGVDPLEVFYELGRRRVIAGQEDLILEIVLDLAKRKGA